MKAREGDLLQTKDGIFYDVKGFVHPADSIVAFPRFIPDPYGKRERQGIHYRKIYALAERYKFLQEHLPHYLVFDPIFGERLCQVPKEDIAHHFQPAEYLQRLRCHRQLDELEALVLGLIESLQKWSMVSWGNLGIAGSLLAQLHTLKSDIDLIVYGKKSSHQVYEALKSMMKVSNNPAKAYTTGELRALYDFRSQDTHMTFADFARVEQRKILQGKYRCRDFYVRCVRGWNEFEEKYGDIRYEESGYAKIKAIVSDASEAIFTPCRYSVDDVRIMNGQSGGLITEIASFRGRFCEQAKEGETVVAQGKVEQVRKKQGCTFFRLLLGSKPSDFMILEQ